MREVSKGEFSSWKSVGVVFLFLALTAMATSAQTFTSLLNFDAKDGSAPRFPLVQGLDGKLYGTTSGGGAHSFGTIFKLSVAGQITTLYSFCSQTNCSDGGSPNGLVLSGDGNFYGTTYTTGTGGGGGTVFKITAGGALTTLHTFAGPPTEGSLPVGIVEGADGAFYGTTNSGGAKNDGTVFKITAAGAFKTLYSFCSQASCADGTMPNQLMQGSDGNLYGTTYGGGAHKEGAIFAITPAGKMTTLHSFSGGDGRNPDAGLMQGEDGEFYGTTFAGGAHKEGTVFKITAGGNLTSLYSFCSQTGCTDGTVPAAVLAQATDGNFYGTTAGGGLSGCSGNFGCGTVFKITSAGALTTLHTFDATDGEEPEGLMQATDGNVYGLTLSGGDLENVGCDQGCGTVYSLSTGLAPFVALVRDSGKVGQKAGILGQGFTGTTGVSFNGISASFTTISNTLIVATVPTGATTGFVTVVTPSGTLTSNVAYRIIP